MFGRLVEMVLQHVARPGEERSIKGDELDRLERRMARINREAAGYSRLVAELDGAVAAFRRRR